MSETKVLTAKDLLAQTEKRKVTFIDVESLGGRLFIREMSAEDIVDLNEGDGSPTERGIDAVIKSLANEDGSPLFSSDKQARQFRSNVGVKTFLEIQQEVNAFNEMSALKSFSLEEVREALGEAGVSKAKTTAVVESLGGEEEGNG